MRGEALVLSVCYRSSGHCGYLTSQTKDQQKVLDGTNKINIGILLKMFSLRVMTVFSSPRKLDLVLMPQNRHQAVTSAVTTLLLRQAWRLAIPTTANQAAQTEHELAITLMARDYMYTDMRLCMWEAREILWAMFDTLCYLHVSVIIGTWLWALSVELECSVGVLELISSIFYARCIY